jgi:hypothetical protein
MIQCSAAKSLSKHFLFKTIGDEMLILFCWCVQVHDAKSLYLLLHYAAFRRASLAPFEIVAFRRFVVTSFPLPALLYKFAVSRQQQQQHYYYHQSFIFYFFHDLLLHAMTMMTYSSCILGLVPIM